MNTHSVFQPPWPQKSGQKLTYSHLMGSSAALAMASLAEQSKKSLLIITPDNLAAQRLEAEMQFFGSALQKLLLSFPDWETLPYDIFSPHQDIISSRLKTLYQIPRLKQSILITPVTTLIHRLAPKEYLNQSSFILRVGELIEMDSFRLQLQKNGYRAVQQVFEHGEFAYRGSIIDIFPMGSLKPFRIDLLGNEVDSIRTFDPETQRSNEKLESIELLPAHEFPLSEDGIQLFRQNWREQFTGNPMNCPLYQSISQGALSPGVEYYLPLFFEKTQTLFDYIPEDTLIISFDDCHHAAEKFWQEINERYEQRQFDITHPIVKPQMLFLSLEEFFTRLNDFSQIKIKQESTASQDITIATNDLPDLSTDNQAKNPLHRLEDFISDEQLNIAPFEKLAPRQARGALVAGGGGLAKLDGGFKDLKNPPVLRTLLLAETAGRREILLELLNKISPPVTLCQNWNDFLQRAEPFCLAVAPLDRGFYLPDKKIALVTESQLFGQQIMQRRLRRPRKSNLDAIVRDLAELHVGTPVVHVDHGIGYYQGLQTITLNEIETEFLTLEYEGGDKLYVPVSNLHLISRYTGVSDHVVLNRLGTEQWQKTKRKAQEQIKDIAAELLGLYAKRAAHEGFAFKKTDGDYEKFAAGFAFELTADQKQAIDEVLKDMAASRPMDRVICGDVGFGKTEVAMRAAFIAANNGKQVAVLVPTTLLAQQHYQNFSDRFADWPIQVEMISRFRTPKEQAAILAKLAEQKIDILIGTHKLLQTDIKFDQLGLLIIDEEHRFGVQQKERFKALRSQVDILTLTATPIPRTLNMAFSGLRELSIIATPPARRLSIKTFVHEKDNLLIQEAILRELLRGGQIYFVHNNVETIEKIAEEIRQIVPQARVGIGHGQMREKELEHIMADFYHQRFNVLVCTTIIETGIDIPTANTIIIDRADKFGLAQLHQLRGRVGRSHHQAYAYLIIPPAAVMTKDAKKRLDAISLFEELGAGFALATHDLEIRGAGELLGEDQSGNIHAIGFSLYSDLLEQAISSLKKGHTPDFEKSLPTRSEVDLKLPALIPQNYIADVHLRLTLYKRIAEALSTENLDEIQVEMIDRFGLLPFQAKHLFRQAELKLKASPVGIVRIDANKNGGFFEFTENPTIDPMLIIHLIQTQPDRFKLDGPKRLRFLFNEPVEGEERIKAIEETLNLLLSS